MVPSSRGTDSPLGDMELFSLALLVEELRRLRRRSFGELGDRDLARQAPALERIARALYPAADSAAPPLRKLLRAAVAEMSNDELGAAAAALFGLEPELYGKNLTARQEAAAACFTPRPSLSTFRQRPQYTRLIIEELAAALGRLSTPVTVQEEQDRQAAETVTRAAWLAEARTVLQDSGKVLWIWGEPGNGKTVLAQQVAGRVRTHLPQVTIRLESSRVAEADVLSAVGHDDVDARSWSPAACRLHLRRMLAEGRSIGVAVIDGVTDEAALWELVPDTLRVPVIVTSRTRSDHSAAAGLRVGAYSPEEAMAAVGTLLPTLSSRDAERLTSAVDHHPLVIDRICRHVLGTAGHSVEEVTGALVADLLTTLDSVDSLSGAAENLSRLYRRTLSTLRADTEVTVEVLTRLLWISSKGTVPKALADDYLRHRFPGVVGTLRVSSALRLLARWAIVAEEDNAFVMHPLTAVILQSLLADSFDDVVTDFFAFLREADPDSSSALTHRMNCELAVTDHVVRTFWGGDQSLLCLGSETWLWVDPHARRPPVRYEVHTDGVHATDGSTRHRLPEEAVTVLGEQIRDCHDALVVLGRLRDPAPVDDHVTEPDGWMHYFERSAQLDDGLTRAVCGKKWVRAPGDVTGLPICPRCSARMAPDLDRMLAQPAPSIPFLLRKLLRAADTGKAEHDVGKAVALLELLRDPSAPFALPEVPGKDELFDMVVAVLKVQHLAADVGVEQKLRWLDDGERWSRRYLELEVDSDYLRAEGFLLLGRTLLCQTYLTNDLPAEELCRRYAEAAQPYRESLALRPDDPRALEDLQEVLTRHAFVLVPTVPMEAERLLREIDTRYQAYLESAPDDVTALDCVGISLANRAKWLRSSDPLTSEELYGRAITFFRRSLDQGPGRLITLRRLSDALLMYADLAAGDPQTAAPRYREAAQLLAQGAELAPEEDAFRRGLVVCAERLRD